MFKTTNLKSLPFFYFKIHKESNTVTQIGTEVLLQVQGRLIIILGVFCPGEDFLPRFKLSLYICIRNVINIKLGSGVSRWSTVPVAKPYVFLPRKTSPNPCCYSSKNIQYISLTIFSFCFFLHGNFWYCTLQMQAHSFTTSGNQMNKFYLSSMDSYHFSFFIFSSLFIKILIIFSCCPSFISVYVSYLEFYMLFYIHADLENDFFVLQKLCL